MCQGHCGSLPQNLLNTALPEVELEVYQDKQIKKVKLSDYQGKHLQH